MNNRYALDSYALLSWLQDEKGAQEVDRLIKLAEDRKASLFLCSVNLGEIFYITHRKKGAVPAQHALSIIDTFPIEIIPGDRKTALKAAELKALYPIAYADAFAAALGIITESIVVTGDPEFKSLKELIKIKWI